MRITICKFTKILQKVSTKVRYQTYSACIDNDGLYVKFGQGIAAMDHLLPPPFYKHMSKLQDKAKAATYE